MSDTNFTFTLDEKLKDKFDRKAEADSRTMAGQLRFIMEAYVENRMEIKEA